MSMLPEHGMKEAITRWGSILTVIILSGICLLSLVLNYQFASASSQVLDVSIQANRLADYSADPVSSPIPVLKMQIIEDVIEDQEPTNVLERLEAVQENLQTLVPTVTPTPPSTNTPVPGVNEPPPTVQAGPTKPPPPASTPTPAGTSVGSASTPTVTKTNTPVSTIDLTTTPGATSTATSPSQGAEMNTPTATDRPTQTSTTVPTLTPTATKKGGKPPTATKTATNTPPPPPTATKTPTRTPPPPPTATSTSTKKPPPPPTATKTLTRTPTKPPTATMTPTSGCFPPDPGMGFISSTTPFDGAVDVPLDITVIIQFNQAMYTGDLFKHIKVSGTKVDYVMSYDPGTHQVEIDFLKLLKKGTKATVEIKRGVKNSCQQRQNVTVKFEFRTVGK